MVVAIIVAILAAVAIPLMLGNKRRAMASEADAGCGSVRTALTVYFTVNGGYPTNGLASSISGMGAHDLDGTYFSTPDYSFTVTGSNYLITAIGNSGASTAPHKADVAGIVETLDNSGNFVRTGL
jgi:type II secretory pathway pseudopilin PulG